MSNVKIFFKFFHWMRNESGKWLKEELIGLLSADLVDVETLSTKDKTSLKRLLISHLRRINEEKNECLDCKIIIIKDRKIDESLSHGFFFEQKEITDEEFDKFLRNALKSINETLANSECCSRKRSIHTSLSDLESPGKKSCTTPDSGIGF